MRTRNTIRNFAFSLTFQFFMLICGLIFPRWIILTFGSEVNGLTQTINQIINYLSLLQTGAIGASVYALYRPVAESNYNEINAILAATRNYFLKIGAVFLICILLAGPAVGLLKSGEGFRITEIVCAVGLMGINASFSFFFFPWYDTLFQSYQQQYLYCIGQFVEKIIYYFLLVLVLRCKFHFLWLYAALICGSLARLTFLYATYKKRYAATIQIRATGGSVTIRNKGYLFANQVVIQAVEGAPVLMISFFYNLKLASVYSVYYMICGLLKIIIGLIFTSCNTSFANYTLTRSSSEVRSIFNLLHYLFSIVGAWVCFCCGSLLLPFVRIYTAGISDINYCHPSWAIIGTLYIASYALYVPFFMLSNIYGLFKETYRPAIICGACTMLVSLLLGIFTNITFLMAAPVLFYAIMGWIRLRIGKRKIDWQVSNKALFRGGIVIGCCIASLWIGYFIDKMIIGFKGWLLAAVIIAVMGALLVLAYSILFERGELRQGIQHLMHLIKKSTKEEKESEQ